uniref:CCHC-type domain-containing protein n=1 Tax=Lactuca sativa TaxID=4236 RepID=A0A9R1UQA5_LACSA|nr:hypothetical protein LSAT_V11C800399110 [Lactuca sativa]
MNIVQEMTMAANVYKAHNNTQLQIVNIITSGFTGSLKGWWDFYISQEEKDYILSAKKTIIKQENNQQIQTFEDDMGLAVCADLRFKEKLKKDRINSKNELGNFCQQYGYQPLNGPSSKYFRKKKYNLPENYKKGKDYASKSKKPDRLNYKKSKRKSKDIIICHKCGRNGHTANNCYAKTKINELNVSEDLKEQIRKIILNTDSDSDESISDFQTNDLNILENTTSSSEDSDICECIGKCLLE